ncbi:MAG: Holliday junction branch migration protein RuvA [Deltaproteobacteria bacterium]|nr:Holliday junction branch migration protein RuvA [Deltaproteobacteria bacterium]
MIAHLSGTLIRKTTESAIIDVGGVGYECLIPLSTFYKLPDVNGPVALCVHTRLTDDAIQLYGFLTGEELEAFRLLISTSGVGPRLARNILSGIGVGELVSSISTGDKARLSSIPGIGVKSAERLILELKDKVRSLAASAPPAARPDGLCADVISALGNLGYKGAEAAEAVKKAKAALQTGYGFEELFKESLRRLSKS